ncbi:MAG: branched-chain amino acid transport system ATP-binding protein [Thermoleophilaceae bacterium]|nr:branched-chain amino acid transport system ATP-binding protein [Thermoleophilaceae bacterium]
MDDALLDVRDLRVSYAGAVRALHGIDMAVAPGSVVAVLGSNGAGKSTLLRAISGTLTLERGTVDGGSISFEGRDLQGVDAGAIVRAGVVQVPEGRRIFGELTVEENLRAGGLTVRDRGARDKARARVYELFPRLEERRRQRGALLSGGEQQMLAIGRALMSSPKLLLLDEPSLGLAPQVVDRIGEVVREINRQGTAVILVEQNAAMALDVADTAYMLEVGTISLSGAASELAATDEVRERYLGVGSAGRDGAPPAEAAEPPATTSERSVKDLSVQGVTVSFAGVTALDDVSFSVRARSVHALIGPNGAGKSTCLNLLTGVYAPAAGQVRYGDVELTSLRPHRIARLGISRTFQNLALSPTASVCDNLLLGRHRLTKAGFVTSGLGLPRARRERAEQRDRAREIADLLSLGDHFERPVEDLSYGDRKRVELGRALCAEPGVLLLDEPVAGMNSDESRQMATTIRDIRAALGISIVLVEHDMSFVMGLADQVTVLDFGRLIADGSPDEVQRDPEVMKAYLGSPKEEKAP